MDEQPRRQVLERWCWTHLDMEHDDERCFTRETREALKAQGLWLLPLGECDISRAFVEEMS